MGEERRIAEAASIAPIVAALREVLERATSIPLEPVTIEPNETLSENATKMVKRCLGLHGALVACTYALCGAGTMMMRALYCIVIRFGAVSKAAIVVGAADTDGETVAASAVLLSGSEAAQAARCIADYISSELGVRGMGAYKRATMNNILSTCIGAAPVCARSEDRYVCITRSPKEHLIIALLGLSYVDGLGHVGTGYVVARPKLGRREALCTALGEAMINIIRYEREVSEARGAAEAREEARAGAREEKG